MAFKYNPFTNELDYYQTVSGFLPLTGGTLSGALVMGTTYIDQFYTGGTVTNANVGGPAIKSNYASNTNLAQSSWYTQAINSFAGNRSNRLSGAEYDIQTQRGTASVTLLGGMYTSVGPNANAATITTGHFSTGRLNIQNRSNMAWTNFYAYTMDTINSNLAGTNVMTITNFAMFHMPDLTIPSAVTVNNYYGIKIDEASAKNYLAGELEIDGVLNHDGTAVGFYGSAPVAQSTGYSVTNVGTTKTYDADATDINEVADVLGNLINDLKTLGLIS